jgi:DNA polymerase
MTPATEEVRAALDALAGEIEACTLCPLHATRTRAVPGEGDPAAELMFVGEAPGYHEDQQGRPFVGQAGKLLSDLLASIGLTREQVFIANVLKSRPPNNRDPLPEEIAACRPYLWRQIELIRPKVICTLGNHATKLISGSPAGITRVHGRPQVFELAGQAMYLYPIFHPAAALYTRAMLSTLQEDFLRLPELLAGPRPQAGDAQAESRESAPAPRAAAAAPVAPAASPGASDVPGAPAEKSPPRDEPEQLGLF